MNNKRPGGRRRQSNSRQRPDLRSGSKSHEKSKGRTDSRLLLRGKPKGQGEENETGRGQRKVITQRNVQGTNEYYTYLKGKSKSKGKIQSGEESSKASYFNNVYMHKEVPNASTETKNQDRPEPAGSNHILNKIRQIEKNGSIDANGKFVVKETRTRALDAARSMDGIRSVDSQQTISINDELRKQKGKKTVRPKHHLKNKPRKEEGRLLEVKSGDRFRKKETCKQVVSPSILEKHTQKYYEAEVSNNLQRMRENPFVRSRQLPKNQPLLSNRTSKTMLTEETQTSPTQGIPDSPKPILAVSIPTTVQQILKQKLECLDPVMLKMLYKGVQPDRIKAVEVISRLCANFRARRQSLAVAVHFMDRYMLAFGKQIAGKKLKYLAVTSLLLALKIDDGIMSRRVCHECIKNLDSVFGHGPSRSGKSKSASKYKDNITSLSRQSSSSALNKSKGNTSTTDLGLSRAEDSKRSHQGQSPIHSKQMTLILALQMDMLKRFRYKIVTRSNIYWADTLTLIWDDYLRQEGMKDQNLLFRYIRQKHNISQCYQMLQKLALNIDSYKYPKPYLVLGCIYLIVRMRMEEQRGQGGDLISKYVTALNKSTNLIFYDNLGVNELFGDYLSQVSLNCVQFVGRQLAHFKPLSFTAKSKYGTKLHQYQLALYEATPDMYKGSEQSPNR